MSWFSQNSCKTSLRIQYVSFRIYTIWYWLLWRIFAVCGWWHASSNISVIRIKILFTLYFFRYITWCRFVFLRKNIWTSKTRKQTSFVSVLMQEKHNNHTWHVVIDEAEKRTYKMIGCEKGMLNFFLGAWKCRL